MDKMPLSVLGPIKDESWDDADSMIQDGSLSLRNESSLTVAGQMQDYIYSSNEDDHWNRGTIQATSKVNEAAEKCGIRGSNQKRSDTLESRSNNKVFNINTMDTGQYRSKRRVEIEAYNHKSDLNYSIKSGLEENIWGPPPDNDKGWRPPDNDEGWVPPDNDEGWGPLENDEGSARPQNENHCPIKKRNHIWKNPIPNPNISYGESKAACYMPEVSDDRIQEQVDWNKSRSLIKNQKGGHDQNFMEPLPCSQRNRTVSQCYIPEDSDSRTWEQIEWKLKKKKQTEKQKGDLDQNLKDLVQGPQRNRRESKTETYVPEASDSRTQGKVDGNQEKDQIENKKGERDQKFGGFVPKTQVKVYWNQENNPFENQEVIRSDIYVSQGVGREKSLQGIQYQECFDFRNQNLTDRKPVYYSDVEWSTKDNGLDRNEGQGDSSIDSKVKGHGSLSSDTGIYRTEESSLEGDEGVGLSGESMSDHFASKKSEVSGDYVHTNYDSQGVCSDEPHLSYDANLNSEVPVNQINFDLSSVQDIPETVQMLAPYIHETHQFQIPNQFVDSRACASQLHSVARPLFPPVNSTAGVLPSTGSSPTDMGITLKAPTQQIPNQAFQPLPTTNYLKLFELLAQEQQRLTTMNYLIQMAIMHPTGLPNNNPDSELQAQQSNLTPILAGLMNSPEQLPTHFNNLLLQSNNASLNSSVPPLLNSSPSSMNPIVAPRNVPLQLETSSFNREGSGLLMPNPYMNMNSAGNRSLEDLSLLNHMSQTNNPNTYTNCTVSTSLNDSAFHGIQTYNPLLMPSNFSIGHDHMAHLNYQSTPTQHPASGNMQSMMQLLAPNVCSQPFGSRPASVGTSSRMVTGKGRGRLIT
jgi:hypothetical protein